MNEFLNLNLNLKLNTMSRSFMVRGYGSWGQATKSEIYLKRYYNRAYRRKTKMILSKLVIDQYEEFHKPVRYRSYWGFGCSWYYSELSFKAYCDRRFVEEKDKQKEWWKFFGK